MAGRKNTRYACKGCANRVTMNQLRASGGRCIYCATPMHHNDWRPSTGNAAVLLNLTLEQDSQLCALAEQNGLDPNELMRVAILTKLDVWLADQTNRSLIDDLLLEKLGRS